jgi:hypothetical protein
MNPASSVRKTYNLSLNCAVEKKDAGYVSHNVKTFTANNKVKTGILIFRTRLFV